MGWVGSTRSGGVDADLVSVELGETKENSNENSATWANKVLLVLPTTSAGNAQPQRNSAFIKFLRMAERVHVAAVISGQNGSMSEGMNLTHTGLLGSNAHFAIPVVSITAEDQQQLVRFLGRGRHDRVHINIQNGLMDEPVESANAVGEIQGTEHPEQIIVVGAHLDSWDLAQGSTDNGFGVACVLGAAEAIARSGFKPKRTIRFVLFTGEEQWMLGSFAYTKSHIDEILANFRFALSKNASDVLPAFYGTAWPRRFRSRLATTRPECVPAIRNLLPMTSGGWRTRRGTHNSGDVPC